MSGTSLRDFFSRTMEHRRIRFGDLPSAILLA
jgi:hypothetical protein